MTARVLTGDCLELMPTIDAERIDAIVTDPPYGLGFMGKSWDHGVPGESFWREALRVAKPGAHLVAFGGTRTYHRLTCAIEDAGWEIRDCLMWLYGSGFPKSLDVSKAIDKAAGVEREKVRPVAVPARNRDGTNALGGSWQDEPFVTAPATDEARQWQGWGTALKPAWEPIILARKALVGTVAANVQAHGTGALNIDGCRLSAEGNRTFTDRHAGERPRDQYRTVTASGSVPSDTGRWPANVCLDEDAAAILDAQAPNTGAAAAASGPTLRGETRGTVAYGARKGLDGDPAFHGDRGGASRFFYTAKASRSERNAGLDGFACGKRPASRTEGMPGGENPRNRGAKAVANVHPTVKPLALMQWLCRLVTPPGGLILDPFCGSGTTGRAALAEGFSFIGIELSEEYATIARARIADYAPLFSDGAA